MRIVADTNIFASASLKESSFPAIVVRWLDQYGGLLKSHASGRNSAKSFEVA